MAFLSAIPRAFLGCRLPDERAFALAERVASVRRDVDATGLRWVHRDRYHATLRFLGPIDARERANLVAAIAPIARASKPVECRFRAALALPSWRRAQVIAVALESSGALEALAREIELGLRDAFGVADKPFRAHVTVVRVSRARAAALARARARFGALAFDDLDAFVVDEIALFRSDATPDGTHYTAVERFRLGAV